MATRIGPKRPVRVFLREWREHLKLTQQDVGARVGDDGVDKGTVSRWESSKRIPSANVLAAYAEALEIPVGNLYRPPAEGPSLDALAAKLSPSDRSEAAEIISILIRRSAGKAA